MIAVQITNALLDVARAHRTCARLFGASPAGISPELAAASSVWHSDAYDEIIRVVRALEGLNADGDFSDPIGGAG